MTGIVYRECKEDGSWGKIDYRKYCQKLPFDEQLKKRGELLSKYLSKSKEV